MGKCKICVGDRVKVDVSKVASNGMHESEEQELRFEYLADHPEEVYTIRSLDADAAANIVLDHPIVGETSFYEDELIKENDDGKEKSEKKLQR